jgi:hypothetical protein
MAGKIDKIALSADIQSILNGRVAASLLTKSATFALLMYSLRPIDRQIAVK